MKFNTILSAFLLLIISSCSSEDIIDGQIENKDSFNYKYNDEEVEITSWKAIKVEDRIEVIGSRNDGRTFYIQFNELGNLSVASSYSNSNFDFPTSTSYEYFKSNYFNFELIGIDESNMRVAVNFSGNLYEDHYDLNSNKNSVEGSFNVKYTEQDPQIEDVKVSAKINGKQWCATDGDQSGGFFSGSNIELNHFSDDEYFISFVVNHEDTVIGDYNFDGSTIVDKVSFYKYNKSTHEIVPYETVGKFTIIEKNIGIQITQLIGNYSFTATNNSDTVQVTDGIINDVYFNY